MPRLKTKGQSCCWEASRVGEEAKQREEKRSDFRTGSPVRLLPGPDKSTAVPRARPRSGPRTQARGPPSAWPSLVQCPWASSSAASGSWCSREAFGRAGMPEPLDVRRRDSVGCAVKCLSAPPWRRARVLQRHRFLPYLRTHIDHKCEREILVESVFLVSYQDRVLPSILLCHIPDHQGAPIHVVSGALLCCHHAILQPDDFRSRERS